MTYSHLWAVCQDQLRAQRSVTSMGSLYLFYTERAEVFCADEVVFCIVCELDGNAVRVCVRSAGIDTRIAAVLLCWFPWAGVRQQSTVRQSQGGNGFIFGAVAHHLLQSTFLVLVQATLYTVATVLCRHVLVQVPVPEVQVQVQIHESQVQVLCIQASVQVWVHFIVFKNVRYQNGPCFLEICEVVYIVRQHPKLVLRYLRNCVNQKKL